MPTYAALIYTPAEMEGQGTLDDWAEVMAEYTAFGEQAADVIVGGEALEDTATATTVQVVGGKGGEILTTDGPFAETKEVLGGFYLLKCADLDEAIRWAGKIPGAWHGKVEVRPVIDFSQGQ
jgi:hypothetical protein